MSTINCTSLRNQRHVQCTLLLKECSYPVFTRSPYKKSLLIFWHHFRTTTPTKFPLLLNMEMEILGFMKLFVRSQLHMAFLLVIKKKTLLPASPSRESLILPEILPSPVSWSPAGVIQLKIQLQFNGPPVIVTNLISPSSGYPFHPPTVAAAHKPTTTAEEDKNTQNSKPPREMTESSGFCLGWANSPSHLHNHHRPPFNRLNVIQSN